MARVKHDWLVYSTQTNNTDYVLYERTWEGSGDNRRPIGPAKVVRKVTILGGANRATKRMVTPLGVMTGISNEDYDFLKTLQEFKRHVDLKHLTVIKGSGWPDDPDDIAQNNLKAKDKSAPITPADYIDKGKTPPIVGTGESQPDTPAKPKAPGRRGSRRSSDPLR
jgi:hypothetical protein